MGLAFDNLVVARVVSTAVRGIAPRSNGLAIQIFSGLCVMQDMTLLS
jgi:hypothetical protein